MSLFALQGSPPACKESFGNRTKKSRSPHPARAAALPDSTGLPGALRPSAARTPPHRPSNRAPDKARRRQADTSHAADRRFLFLRSAPPVARAAGAIDTRSLRCGILGSYAVSSYALSQSADLLHNLSQTAEKLGQHADAIQFEERLLTAKRADLTQSEIDQS